MTAKPLPTCTQHAALTDRPEEQRFPAKHWGRSIVGRLSQCTNKRFASLSHCVMDLLIELFKIPEWAIRTVFPSTRRAALMPRMLPPLNLYRYSLFVYRILLYRLYCLESFSILLLRHLTHCIGTHPVRGQRRLACIGAAHCSRRERDAHLVRPGY